MNKLNIEETEKIQKFVTKYRTLHSQIAEMEKALKGLTTEREILVIEMSETRRDESEFFVDLQQKYGKDIINIELLKEIVV